MMQTATQQEHTQPPDAAQLAAYRRQIARVPVTMRPALNQQLSAWETLFPFERKQLASFMRGLEAMQPAALDELTQPLRMLEAKMGVEHWNFSESSDTMENASMLARSEFYADWRREVQRIFEAVNNAARGSASAEPMAARLVLIVLPASLPVDELSAWKPWDKRAKIVRIDGDAGKVAELLLQGQPDQPGVPALLAGNGSLDESDLWIIDADAGLEGLHNASSARTASSLSYAALRPFRDKFLAEVNTVPKSIEATDQILASLRQRDWEQWWPAQLAGQARLRSFVIDLFLSGNGALIFSNAFVEWAASEAMRRARPRLVAARFGLRSKPKPFTGIAIFENQQQISALPEAADPQGSAIDAVILARYIWLSARRFPEQERTFCLCVSEHRNAATLITPEGIDAPWETERAVTPQELSAWIGKQFMA